MAEQIKDGTGSGTLVGVDAQNRLETFTVTESGDLDASNRGDAYNINTGIISLTNAVDTPVLYIKNNEDRSLIVTGIVIGVFNSTNGSSTADMYATFVRNPTAGTINESAPADVAINSNRNYSSSQTLTADAYVGATDDTMTNGDDHIIVRLSAGSRSLIGITEVLGQGATLGVKIKPPTSNTAMSCYVAAVCYLHKKD